MEESKELPSYSYLRVLAKEVPNLVGKNIRQAGYDASLGVPWEIGADQVLPGLWLQQLVVSDIGRDDKGPESGRDNDGVGGGVS